jgi:acetoin utilization protein AcuB
MRQLFANLWRDEGAAVVEFAAVLGLTLLSAAAAMLLLGDRSARSLSRLSNWDLNESLVCDYKAETPLMAAPDESQASPSAEFDSAPPGLLTVDQSLLTALLASLAVMCYAAIRWRRANRYLALAQLDDDREVFEQADNERFRKRQQILKMLSADSRALAENRIEVRHLMTTDLRTVRPKTTLDELRRMMAQEHARFFPVVTEKGTLAGIVSDRDLMNHVARRAADVMCASLITVKPTAKLAFAVAQMINRNLSCLPVTEGDRLVGILTTTDLVLTLQCVLQLGQRRSDFPIRVQDGGLKSISVESAGKTAELEAAIG